MLEFDFNFLFFIGSNPVALKVRRGSTQGYKEDLTACPRHDVKNVISIWGGTTV